MSQPKSLRILIVSFMLLVPLSASSRAIQASAEKPIAQPLISNLAPQGWFPMRSLPQGQSLISNLPTQHSALLFVPNQGQWPAEVRFQMRGLGGTWWFTGREVWMTLVKPSVNGYETDERMMTAHNPYPFIRYPSVDRSAGVHLRLTFPNLSPAARLVPSDEQPSKMNYLLGNDATQWRSNVPTYAALRWEDVLPGVDVEFAGDGWQVSGENAAHLRLNVEGADTLRVDDAGRLLAETAIGSAPLPISVAALDGNIVSLSSLSSLSSFSSLSPVDDPADLLFSTFLGGNNADQGERIKLGPDGSVYVVGYTYSQDFPTTPGAIDRTYEEDWDAFVSRLSAAGSSLLYSTYLGGRNSDFAQDVVARPDGSMYVTGRTASPNFPTTPGAYDRVCGGCEDGEFGPNTDAFVMRLNADGSRPIYSTLLGELYTDSGYSIAVVADGSAYVSGDAGPDFPTTPGAFQTTSGGSTDAYVSRLSADGSTLVYSTFLGGSTTDLGWRMLLGADGSAYVSGWTNSTDFPVTPEAFDPTDNPDTETYVSRLSADLSSLVYSTYLGGGSADYGDGLALGAGGSAYVTGQTFSSDFPVTPGAFDTTYRGNLDSFVSRLSPDGASLLYSTFLGGGDVDNANQVAVGTDGTAYVTGYTNSSDFPVTPGALDTSFNGCGLYWCDAFVSRLSADGSSLLYSTFLGGGIADRGEDIAAGPDGSAYVTGYTDSSGFPTTPGAFDPTCNNCYSYNPDAFVSRLNPDLPTMHVASIDPAYRPAGQAYRLRVVVTIVDAAGQAMAGARVRIQIDLPTGRQVGIVATTGDQGHLARQWTTSLPGTYTFTLTSVSKAGYIYDPAQNVETSDSITIP